MVWFAVAAFTLAICLENFRWRRTVRLFGNVPTWVPTAMLKFARIGRAGMAVNAAVSLLALSCVCLSLFILKVGAYPFGQLALLLGSIGLSIFSRCAQPPAVLLLTSSSPRTVELIERFRAAIFPLRVIALVDHGGLRSLNPLAWVDNLRTSDPAVWKSVVISLIELAPVVVIDTCGESRSVSEETSLMLSPDRIRKAVFLTDNFGRYPALSVNGIDPFAHAVRLLNVDEMVETLAHYSLGRDYLPWPTELPLTDPRQPLIKENWESLPSVLMVGLAGGDFDSRWLVDAALRSDKDLLTCASPWFDISRSGAEHLLSLDWEFIHNHRLAAIAVREQQVVVRIAFLREFAAELPQISATGHRGPHTWEELNQPDPVDAALWRWAHAIENTAEKHGWKVRQVLSPPNDETETPEPGTEDY